MSTTTAAFSPPSADTPPPRAQDPHGDPYRLGCRSGGGDDESIGHGSGGPSPKHIVVGYGFWIFILSDIITFATLFSAYAVLKDATAGGPSGADLFERGRVAVETTCLLLSSVTCGLAIVAMRVRNRLWFQVAMLATAALGAAFLLLEAQELAGLAAKGGRPQPLGLPVGLLSPWWAATACTSAWACCGFSR